MLLTVRAIPKEVTFLFVAEEDLIGAVAGTRERRTAHPRRSVTFSRSVTGVLNRTVGVPVVAPALKASMMEPVGASVTRRGGVLEKKAISSDQRNSDAPVLMFGWAAWNGVEACGGILARMSWFAAAEISF